MNHNETFCSFIASSLIDLGAESRQIGHTLRSNLTLKSNYLHYEARPTLTQFQTRSFNLNNGSPGIRTQDQSVKSRVLYR